MRFSFGTKVALVQSITDIVLLGFLPNTTPLNVYFILHHHLFLSNGEHNIYLRNHEIKLVFEIN